MKELLNTHCEASSEKYLDSLKSEKYLGLPTDVGNSANGALKYLKDKV